MSMPSASGRFFVPTDFRTGGGGKNFIMTRQYLRPGNNIFEKSEGIKTIEIGNDRNGEQKNDEKCRRSRRSRKKKGRGTMD